MGRAGVYNLGEFREFEDSLRNIKARVPSNKDPPSGVLRAGIQDTIAELKREIVKNVDKATTSKGGTFDSRSSPYEPGGENDSGDGHHLADVESWNDYRQTFGYVVQPAKSMEDRAYWMEEGTSDHGPNGDDPMYFYVGGSLVIMAEKPKRSSPFYKPYIQQSAISGVEGAAFNYGEPTTVDGVEAQHFMREAVNTLAQNRALERNIRRRWKVVLQEELNL